jgi:5-carboxymethyl-2-hydroxymuconate isomerase
MKITKFRLSVCLDEYIDDFVHITFEYGDGNYGDDTMPHYDEIWDILDYKFEPAICEGRYPTLNLEKVIMNNQGDWIDIED